MNFDYWLRRISGRSTCMLGTNSKLTSTARIRNIRGNNEHISVASHSLIAGELLVFAHGGSIAIGDWCYVGEGARIWSASAIHIGNRVMISHNVNIFDNLTHPLSAILRHKHFHHIATLGHPSHIDLGERPVKIGHDAWIAAGATVLRGVTIGEGAIVGAGSVVSHDVAPWTVVAGNPARVISRLEVEALPPEQSNPESRVK